MSDISYFRAAFNETYHPILSIYKMKTIEGYRVLLFGIVKSLHSTLAFLILIKRRAKLIFFQHLYIAIVNKTLLFDMSGTYRQNQNNTFILPVC